VLGHINAAASLGEAYGVGTLDSGQLAEVRALQAAYAGNTSDIARVLGGYEASGDYWKVIKGADGKVLGVIDDQNYETITYVDAAGNTLAEEIAKGSLSKQIADSTGQRQTKDEVNKLMISSGLWHSGESGTRWYVSDTGKQHTISHTLDMSSMVDMTASTSASATGIVGRALEMHGGLSMANAELTRTAVKELWDWAGGLFGRQQGNTPETMPRSTLFDATVAVLGDGSLEKPNLRTGAGFFNQTTQYADLGFNAKSGSCFVFSSMGPFLDAGYSQEQIITALKAVGSDNFGPDGEVTGDINTVWEQVAQQLGADKHPAYLGAGPGNWRPSHDIAGFKATGATMGLYNYQNPNGDGQHWMYLSRQQGSWNAYDPWNVGPKGLFDVWQVKNWSKIEAYTIRPLTWVEGKKGGR
jgi:hypothetical protein